MKFSRFFGKYFIRYFLLLLFVLVFSIPVALIARNQVMKQYISQNTANLLEGKRTIEDNVDQMRLIAQATKNNENFRALSKEKGEISNAAYGHVKSASQFINYIAPIYKFSPYFVVIYKDNPAYVSSGQCGGNINDNYYGNFFGIVSGGREISSDELRSMVFDEGKRISYIPVDSGYYYLANSGKIDVSNCIICSVKQNTEANLKIAYAILFLIDGDEITGNFLNETNNEYGILQIADSKTGDIIFKSEGFDSAVARDYYFVTETSENLGLDFQIGIHNKSINDFSMKIVKSISIYSLVGLLVATIIAVFLTYREYHNISRLLSAVNRKRAPKKGKNEYDEVVSIISEINTNASRYEDELKSLYDKQREMQLLKVLSGGMTNEEKDTVDNLLGNKFNYFCVIAANFYENSINEHSKTLLYLLEILKDRYKDRFVHIKDVGYREVFIFALEPSSSPNLDAIQQESQDIIDLLSVSGNIVINVGISTVGAGYENLNRCYDQAIDVLRAYEDENKTVVNCFRLGMNDEYTNIIRLENLNRLYNAVSCCSKNEVESIFDSMLKETNGNKAYYELNKKNVFYSLFNCIYDVYIKVKKAEDDKDILLAYDADEAVPDMLVKVKDMAYEVCSLIEKNKKSKNEKLKKDIIEFIESNYSDPGITPVYVAEKMGISEKYLTQYLKEQTGESFSVYLERVRLEAARELLLNTDMSNESIASATGFGATNSFYRVFNKKYGVSPKAFRDSNK